jgi:hypothetical protein
VSDKEYAWARLPSLASTKFIRENELIVRTSMLYEASISRLSELIGLAKSPQRFPGHASCHVRSHFLGKERQPSAIQHFIRAKSSLLIVLGSANSRLERKVMQQ